PAARGVAHARRAVAGARTTFAESARAHRGLARRGVSGRAGARPVLLDGGPLSVRMEKEFDVERKRSEAAAALADDDLLGELFPDTRTEIVERKGRRKTIKSHYTALGREGVATFHFDFEPGGDLHFEKVCDGRVWRELRGAVTLTEHKTRTR